MQRAKIFKNGQSQAIRLPKNLRFEGREVYAKKVGATVVLMPLSDPWSSLREGLALFSDDFMAERPPQLEQKRRLFGK
jgi:antitoxin VapB